MSRSSSSDGGSVTPTAALHRGSQALGLQLGPFWAAGCVAEVRLVDGGRCVRGRGCGRGTARPRVGPRCACWCPCGRESPGAPAWSNSRPRTAPGAPGCAPAIRPRLRGAPARTAGRRRIIAAAVSTLTAATATRPDAARRMPMARSVKTSIPCILPVPSHARRRRVGARGRHVHRVGPHREPRIRPRRQCRPPPSPGAAHERGALDLGVADSGRLARLVASAQLILGHEVDDPPGAVADRNHHAKRAVIEYRQKAIGERFAFGRIERGGPQIAVFSPRGRRSAPLPSPRVRPPACCQTAHRPAPVA